MKTKLKELTEEIQKQIPEIVFEYEEYETILENVGSFVRQSQQPTGIWNTFERDITLEDILRVMKTKENRKFENQIDLIRGSLKDLGATAWQLGKPLHQQKTETIDLLYKLICGNNERL